LNKYILYLLFISFSTTLTAKTLQDTTLVETTIITEETIKTAEPPVYTQRSFGTNLKEKYNSPEFKYESKTKAKSAWDRFWDAVARFFEDLFRIGNNDGVSSSLDIFLKITALIIIVAVVYMIVRIILKKEGMWIFGRSRKNIKVQDITEEDIHHMDFRDLIHNTKKAQDYRLAVRYYYLWLLKKLSANEVIDWHWDKTNSDYLYEIKNTMLKKDFEYLSYVYDYSWYGDFPIDEAAFAKAEKAFLKTLNTL
jgi:hypothetical protein